jgi:hypothetical protein
MSRFTFSIAAFALSFVATSAQAGTLLLDTYNTDNNPNGDGWYDVNHQYNVRQSGSLAPIDYAGNAGYGSYQTQVNNPGFRNTLLFAANPGQYIWVSPNHDFVGDAVHQRLHVEINPQQLQYGDFSTDHWAALVFGTTQGQFIIGTGTGVLVRQSGEYQLWNNGNLDSIGNVGAKPDPDYFYSIDFDANMTTGDYSLKINGNAIFSGSHGAYSTNYVTLAAYTGDGGLPVDYLDNLTISAVPEPASATLLGVGVAAFCGLAWRRRKRN